MAILLLFPPPRPADRRLLALLLLTLIVSVGHVSMPWALMSSGRQIAFGDKVATPPVAIATRSIIATSLPPPAETPTTPRTPPRDKLSSPDSGSRQPAKPTGVTTEPLALAPPPPDAPADQPSSAGTAILYSISGRFAGQLAGGSAKLQWKLDPTAYLMSLQVTGSHQFSPLFAWNAKTSGVVGPMEMWPDAYDEELLVAGEDQRAYSLTFPRAESLGSAEEQPSATVSLDPLSSLLKLGSDLHALRQSGTSPIAGSVLPPITVRLGSRTLQLKFERQDDETLSSPFGLMRTEKFVTKHSPAQPDEPQIRLWLAPEFRYVPVRVVVMHTETTTLSFDLFSEPAEFPAWR